MTFLAASLAAYAVFVCLYAMKFLDNRPVAILFMIVAIIGHHFLILEALGKAKPYEVELLRDLDGAQVMAFEVADEKINVWLLVDGQPMAYAFAYSDRLLAEIHRATEGAGRDNRAVVKVEEDPTGEQEDDLTFHPAPVMPMEQK